MSVTGFALAALISIAVPASAQVVVVYQGADWTAESRETFYTQDQGSRIMPLAWMQALKQPNGEPFLGDRLERYGYLPNPLSATPDLPVGFTVANDAGGPSIGMTCSACHTRQIDVNGTAYRIDGGPAIVDFQSFLKDLNDAVQAVRATPEAFAAFADAVLGAGASDAAKERLKVDLEVWHLRFGTLIERSLPNPAWGPSRLDAVSMIFNRLAGLDLGEPPTYLIPDNIARADAPSPLSVPVERAGSGQDTMAGVRRQRQRHPRAVPQPRRGLRRFRSFPSGRAERDLPAQP